MQELKLADELFFRIFDGTKSSTIRKGKRDIDKGFLAFTSTGQKHFGIVVNVTGSISKKLNELSQNELVSEGYSSLNELKQSLEQYYSDIDDNTLVTIIKFEYIDPFAPSIEVFAELEKL